MVVWFLLNYGKTERHLRRTIYPFRKKPQIRYTTNMKCPNFILVTHFTPKIQLITIFKELGKNSPQKFEIQFITHVREGDRMM